MKLIKYVFVTRAPDGSVARIDATPNLENKDYKKTLKLTWLADTPQSPTVETYCVFFDHIISKPVLGKDEDFKKYIGHQTRVGVFSECIIPSLGTFLF